MGPCALCGRRRGQSLRGMAYHRYPCVCPLGQSRRRVISKRAIRSFINQMQTQQKWKQLIRRDPCAYCGGPGGTMDHIRPQASGGQADWKNVTGACRSCNNKKCSWPLLMFLARRSQCTVQSIQLIQETRNPSIAGESEQITAAVSSQGILPVRPAGLCTW